VVSASLNPAADRAERWMLDAVRDLFLRMPESFVLSSKQIARSVGIRDGEAQPLTRAVIAELVREGLPLGAESKGYRMLRTEGQLRAYLADLHRRARAIDARIVATERAFREYWGATLVEPRTSHSHLDDFLDGGSLPGGEA